MTASNRDYVEVVYDEIARPLTGYPQQLAHYLFHRYNMKKGERFLEVGCGRGEFIKGFISLGVEGHAIDQSLASRRYCPEAIFKSSDIENDGIPFEDDYFDIVYSKSVIEHFHYPERLMREVFRVLKPGGLVLTLCPSWEHNFRMYFEDYTHRTPFMLNSLRDIHLIHGFCEVRVEFFRQLPLSWNSLAWSAISEVTRILAPSALKKHSKWVRFSKEIMLLSSARKPIASSVDSID